MPETEQLAERVRALEAYQSGHQAEVTAWWRAQWEANRDTEARLRELERWRQRAIGVGTILAGASALAGAVVGNLLVR